MARTHRKTFTVEVQHPGWAGTPTIVRVYRRGLFRKRPVSSDWFLDAAQAEQFAAEIRQILSDGRPLPDLKRRSAGWTLHRPAR